MKKLLTSNRAEGYIDTVVMIVAAMMVIVLALNVFSFLMMKQEMDYFAKEIIDTATIYGKTTGETTQRYKALVNELGFVPSMTFSGTEFYNSSTGTVQLGDTIHVTITYRAYLQGFGIFRIPIVLKVHYSGLSQKYWK